MTLPSIRLPASSFQLRPVDIVAEGYDPGVGMSESIKRDWTRRGSLPDETATSSFSCA
jgi:hypothetical protein